MALHFILGGAGAPRSSGLRDRLVRSAVEHPDLRHVMLVPAQFTMQTQRDIVAAHPRHAVMNIDVLSFERLFYRVMGEVGGEELSILTDMGKNMLLRKVAGAHKEELSVYRRSLRKPGFISRLTQMLSEFYEYGVTEEALEEMQGKVTGYPLLERKLKDLSIFYRAMGELKGRNTIAAEELLPLLNRKLPESEYLKGTVVGLDYFTGFTPVQLLILRTILCQAEDVYLNLMLPEEEEREEARETDLFYMSKTTLRQVSGMTKSCGSEVFVRFLPERVEDARKDLRFLRDHFLRNGKKESFDSVPESVSVVSARTPREEARWAASVIARLVRQEGIRYREIAVIVGDIEEYRPSLRSAFERESIPCFMDRKKGLMGNPLVEFLRSAAGILEKDFSYESVFRHLKCGISSLEQEEMDRLDEYVISCGIRGRRRWEEEWSRIPDPKRTWDLVEINASRAKVLEEMKPLLALSGKGKNWTVAERTSALREMMENIGARNRMEDLAEERRNHGNAEAAEEYERICDYLEDFFSQMEQLLGNEIVSRQEFMDILDAGLSEAKLGMLPSGLDLVQVGDVRRSRLTDIKALLVLGMNDGLIPGKMASGGILSEWERQLLLDRDLELAPTAENAACQDRFYLYSLMTRPGEKLYLSFSRTGNDGVARRPSYLLQQVLKMFPALTVQPVEKKDWKVSVTGVESAWQVLAENIRDMSREGAVEAGLSEKAREKGFSEGAVEAGFPGRTDEAVDRAFFELVHTLAESPEGERRLRSILDASFRVYEGTRIPQALAGKLYGGDLLGSITRLEQYAACPAHQFLTYGLHLSERRDAEITMADRGTFFHKVLELFFRLLKERELSWKSLTEEERKELVEQSLTMAAEEEGILLRRDENAGSRYLYERMGRTADRTIWAVCKQLSESDFTPEDLELSFNGWTTQALQLALPGGGRLILTGKVDRLDVYEEGERRYLRVVDYKSGKKNFDLNEVWQGMSLQLVVYLDAVEELERRRHADREILPGGLYYYSVGEPVIDAAKAPDTESWQREMLKEMQPKGLVNAAGAIADHQESVSGKKLTTAQFRALSSHVREVLTDYGQAILDGNADVLPYQRKERTGCDYCPYQGVCGLDLRVEGYGFRKIPELSDKAILEELTAMADSARGGDRG